MKKIGKQVLMLATSENNARNGEGAFLKLKDGRIMFAFSYYITSDWRDHSTSQIAVIYSNDDGETWTKPTPLWGGVDEGVTNNMCVSLIRKNNGDIAIFYLQKYTTSDGLIKSRVASRISNDEGKTWQDYKIVIDQDGYLVKENDRLVRLSSGRLILPLNHHGDSSAKIESGVAMFFFSDDDGETFNLSPSKLSLDDPDGMQETGVMERKDCLWSFSRTTYGFQYESFSYDNGQTWSDAVPNKTLTSPRSPMAAKNFGKGYSLVVINPIPTCFGFPNGIGGNDDAKTRTWARTPLLLGLSNDENNTFINKFYIEDDLNNGYCYTSIFDGGNYLLLAYYHSNNGPCPLTSCKIVKITYSELGIEE